MLCVVVGYVLFVCLFVCLESLSEKIVQAGFAKIREQQSKKGTELVSLFDCLFTCLLVYCLLFTVCREYDRILQMKEEAESQKLGMYSLTTTDSVRNVQYITQDNANQFTSSNQGKEFDGKQ